MASAQMGSEGCIHGPTPAQLLEPLPSVEQVLTEVPPVHTTEGGGAWYAQ